MVMGFGTAAPCGKVLSLVVTTWVWLLTGTCFLWYCQLYDVYCLSSSVHSDKSLSEPSFDWSTTTTLAWCSCDLKSFWCPWNAKEVSHVLGWRACYAFLCDQLVDYVRCVFRASGAEGTGTGRTGEEAQAAQDVDESTGKETQDV